jgi:adenylate cyclase
VTARTTAAAYGHKTVDAREIGKALDVRYILEGSIQRDQTRAHVNAQLIDAQSGAHLWADHFDENASDLFDFQSQVVTRLAYALRHQLIIAEAEKGAQSKSPDAINLAMRGRALMLGTQPPTKEKNDAAIVLFEQALKIDPDEPGAIAGLALAYGRSEAYRWNSGAGYAAKILELSRRAIELDPDNIAAYIAQAYYFDLNERWQDVIRAANAGLAIDPNFAALYAARAAGEGQVARYPENISDRQKAKQLKRSNPDPDVHYWEW